MYNQDQIINISVNYLDKYIIVNYRYCYSILEDYNIYYIVLVDPIISYKIVPNVISKFLTLFYSASYSQIQISQ